MYEFNKEKQRKYIVFGRISMILLLVAAIWFLSTRQYIHLIWVGFLLLWQLATILLSKSIDCDALDPGYLDDDDDDDIDNEDDEDDDDEEEY